MCLLPFTRLSRHCDCARNGSILHLPLHGMMKRRRTARLQALGVCATLQVPFGMLVFRCAVHQSRDENAERECDFGRLGSESESSVCMNCELKEPSRADNQGWEGDGQTFSRCKALSISWLGSSGFVNVIYHSSPFLNRWVRLLQDSALYPPCGFGWSCSHEADLPASRSVTLQTSSKTSSRLTEIAVTAAHLWNSTLVADHQRVSSLAFSGGGYLCTSFISITCF